MNSSENIFTKNKIIVYNSIYYSLYTYGIGRCYIGVYKYIHIYICSIHVCKYTS